MLSLPSILDAPQRGAGTSVLLTGATGFVGSAVLESLLRTCPGKWRVGWQRWVGMGEWV